ncbi:MAG TPA: DUF3137 domain-containing protein [Emcibacteraceae bacterium]|nr:DUF3137 domain-containing protein [Emcibacteraceae bacterium]HRW29710.1 DUF3137 domain-containing protein [Emcibacteraceae bacterium]
MTIDDMRQLLHSFDGSGFKSLLDELEAKRQRAFTTFLGALFICGLIVIFILLTQGDADLFQISVGLSFIVCMVFYRRMAVIRREAKRELMPALCHNIGLEYLMTPSSHLIAPFDQLSIIPGYDEKTLEDQIFGKIEDVDFQLFEAKLITVSRDSKGRRTTTTVFNGFLVQFNFHKNFKGQTIITKDHTAIGNFLTGWTRSGERVKLEDSVFESEFEVYSTDQVEARYLLTPTFMERLLEFSRLPNIKQLQLAFKDGSIYMAIKRSGNAFEGGSYKLNDPELIKQNIKDIAQIFDMVTELKLTQNTRI